MGERPLALPERLALRPKEAAKALGLSERKFREVMHELPHVFVGGVRLFPVTALREWLARGAAAEKGRIADLVDDLLQASRGSDTDEDRSPG